MADKKSIKNNFNDRAVSIFIRDGAKDSPIAVRDLTLTRPDTGEPLIENINFDLEKGERLVIMGPAGCGKSSLLRTIAGIWDHGEGEVSIPKDTYMLFVAQNRYIPLLPLQDILCYPKDPEDFTLDEMKAALKKVGLARHIPELEKGNTDGNLYLKKLSGGEQQRLVFARLLLNKPDILIMDEVTSSLDEKWEMSLYKLLVDTLPDTTIISISHRRSIIPFHTQLATVEDGKLTVESLTPDPEKDPQPDDLTPDDDPQDQHGSDLPPPMPEPEQRNTPPDPGP